jgi:hypothetical protein
VIKKNEKRRQSLRKKRNLKKQENAVETPAVDVSSAREDNSEQSEVKDNAEEAFEN